MNNFQILSAMMTILGVMLIPLMAMAVRGLVKWTKSEVQLTQVAKDLAALVEDKDKTHAAMQEQMKYDRDATNRRLEWLEHNLWGSRVGKGAR